MLANTLGPLYLPTMKGTRHHRIRAPGNRDTGWSLGARRRDTAPAWKPGEALPATGLQVAGQRFYSPEFGRWLSRDPIRERGGVNLSGFTFNQPVGRRDALGLASDAEAFLHCHGLMEKVRNGASTGDARIDALTGWLRSNGCRFSFSCCRPCGYCGPFRKTDAGCAGGCPPTYPLHGRCDVAVCAGTIGNRFPGTFRTMIVQTARHELAHCVQRCARLPRNDCPSCLCRELRAIQWGTPEATEEEAKQWAVASCTASAGAGESGQARLCDGVDTSSILTTSFVQNCRTQWAPEP